VSGSDDHIRHMRQAFALASEGIALCSPNPCVGALIVAGDGSVIATGSHTYDGIKHAEVLAIETAQRNGRSLSGATLYINLEPCSHHGRTPPCVEAIITSGIRSVVTAMRDPNPLVSGRGIEQLRAAGINVVEDILGDEARKLNEAFAKYIRQRTPFITLKAGMTLDGKIAPPPASLQNPKPSIAPASAPGDLGNPAARGAGSASGGWITSEAARAHAQQLRHASDAVMVGVGTVIADDPLLTDRTGKARRRPLLRVILDSRLRLPLESRVVKTAQSDVVVFCAFAEEKKRKALEQRRVQVVQVALAASVASAPLPPKVRRMLIRRRTATGKPIRPPLAPGMEGRPDLRAVLTRLGEMEITSALIEGGALVNWTALEAGAVDKVFLYYAPKILAGMGSIPFAAGAGFQRISEAAQVHRIAIHHFGEDFAVEGYLRDPYS
jgi:diaminohydroxyphosphoribosylaminopyrimidine deaminase / 5-amino-6-(5-phosphoribosylamino)uracil reductase